MTEPLGGYLKLDMGAAIYFEAEVTRAGERVFRGVEAKPLLTLVNPPKPEAQSATLPRGQHHSLP